MTAKNSLIRFLKLNTKTIKLKLTAILAIFMILSLNNLSAQTGKWQRLFNDYQSNAMYPEGIWTADDGVITVSEDQEIRTKRD